MIEVWAEALGAERCQHVAAKASEEGLPEMLPNTLSRDMVNNNPTNLMQTVIFRYTRSLST